MGHFFSRPIENNEPPRPISPHKYSIHSSTITPDEVSQEPEDCKSWYAEFMEQAYVAPHRDGKSVVLFWPAKWNSHFEDDEKEKAIVTRGAEAYEHLFFENGGHPRIVKYLYRLDSSIAGFCLERLTPGPLQYIKLPPLTLPLVSPSTTETRLLLALYYRWALQRLSALHFINSKFVFLTNFCEYNIWVRADMSVAITGFLGAAMPIPVPEGEAWDETDEAWDGTDDVGHPLEISIRLEPDCDLDDAGMPDFQYLDQTRFETHRRKFRHAWQSLEEERLGHIFVKAWNLEYENAGEAMLDVKEVIKKMGLKLVGDDEIELDGGIRWEDVFEVVRTGPLEDDQELRVKSEVALRPVCVELNHLGLKFRGNLATSNDVCKALEAIYSTLSSVSKSEGLDEKLAEYAFIPLSHVFNQSQQLSVRCVELAVQSLQLLVSQGWRTKLSSELGKQLLILMVILFGGAPTQNQNQPPATAPRPPRSEELTVAIFDCIAAICSVLRGSDSAAAIFNQVGAATIVDQAVYILLEGILDGASDEIQLSAATALEALQARVTNRVVLASLMPRTVSSLTKTLRSTSQSRRTYKVLSGCLAVLRGIIRTVLNDRDVTASEPENGNRESRNNPNALVLDASWLNATTSQIKLALANIIRLRNHEKSEVRDSLLELCLMIIEDCPKSLAESLPMMVETIVVLSDTDPGKAYSALKHVITSSTTALDSLKSSQHTWVVALPRIMQSSDDLAKQRAIRQVTTAYQALSETQHQSKLLDDIIATNILDSVTAALLSSSNKSQPEPLPLDTGLEALALRGDARLAGFPSILLEQQSQKQTRADLQTLIVKLSNADTHFNMAQFLLGRLYGPPDDAFVSAFWLAVSFLKNTPPDTLMIDDILDLDPEETSLSRPHLIEELYSVALPILTELKTSNPTNWRIPALALEAIALQAQQLAESFRPELIDCLYPVLQLIGSSNPQLRQHAITCLNIMTSSCGYRDASALVIENVDYLVNSVALKLNTFDISPQAPQVMLMMMKLCGARLIPYLDDLIGSIFAVLDAFHGYPKLVLLLFSVLGSIVDESAKKPEKLAIMDGGPELPSRKDFRLRPRSVSTIAEWFKIRCEKNSRELKIEEPLEPHPKEPWTSKTDRTEDEGEDIETDSQADQSAPPEEEQKSLSKPHNLLLNIMKSIPPHLSSPSPFLRKSLLEILARGLPTLSRDENSFLPLINELWPAVSARIAISSSTVGQSVQSKDAPTTTAVAKIDENAVQEEVFVTAASCLAIETMCLGAGDFMSSRIEHDFPRWKRLYTRCWNNVLHDAEKIAQRQRQQVQKDHPAALREAMLIKSFTSHHRIWKSLTSLFITILSHVRLPADIGDEICYSCGEWIAFFHPTLSSTSYEAADGVQMDLVDSEHHQLDDVSGTTGTESRWEQGSLGEAHRALRAMQTWNPDLAWFIFTEASTKDLSLNNTHMEGGSMFSGAFLDRMNQELSRLKLTQESAVYGESGDFMFAGFTFT
ncbi:hypothetical protein FQN57_003429 [Myotisia sp. PD_48]|nr:hypothetical protein FQN57_003429 [Myotisia sp. PD_48]